MLDNTTRVLVLAPHTDDGEFGCGATIAKFRQRGARVRYVAFSDCRDSLPPGWPPDTLVKEAHAATAVLGLPAGDVDVLGFTVRNFTRDRQEILERLVLLQREFEPELVLLPSLDDLHQDHHTIAMEGLRAFKRTTVLAYEIPWNNIHFRNELFVHLTQDHVRAKVQACSCYASQQDRYYANEQNILAQLRMRGCQVGVEFAEVFEVVRAVAR
jgi:LmbE family N-acetylglucosaminyl deacetylase